MAREIRKSAAHVIVRHQIRKVEVLVQSRDVVPLIVVRTRGNGHGEEEVRGTRQVAGVGVEFFAKETAGFDEVLGVLWGVGIFPVEI